METEAMQAGGCGQNKQGAFLKAPHLVSKTG